MLAVTAWGMFIRARRQLLFTLRERALRAEADQRLHDDRARMAERTRIAREMHDVLAHRISLLALHAGALEVRPDLPPEKVRETAELLRSTARQALEELRGVIGVLREDPGQEPAPPAPAADAVGHPPPGRGDPAGRREDRLRDAGGPPGCRARARWDATPIASCRSRSPTSASTPAARRARVRVTGRAGQRPARQRPQPPTRPRPTPDQRCPGPGAGLLGLQERVALAGGTLVHGPDGSGDFVVDAELPW